MRGKTAWTLAAVLLTLAAGVAAVRQRQPRRRRPAWQRSPPTRCRRGTTARRKKSIVDFVARVTREGGPDFVPPSERIATFDNDGTLWSEKPVPFQVVFAFDRVKALAPQHPGMEDPRAVRLTPQGRHGRRRRERREGRARDHGRDAHRHDDRRVLGRRCRTGSPRRSIRQTGRLFTEMVYQPMLEAARLPARQRLQDLHRLRRRRRVHAPVGGTGLWHSAGAGRRQQRQAEARGRGTACRC